MRRSIGFSYKRYIVLGGILFLLVSLPTCFMENLRGKVLGFFLVGKRNCSGQAMREVERLEIENHILRTEFGKLKSLFEQQRALTSLEMQIFSEDLSVKKCEEMRSLLDIHRYGVTASVIYRDPETWSSSIWINVGEEDNRIRGHQIVKKNSPVLSGFSVVGVVESVGRKRSRVRLITDVGLKPSVRVARGFSQNALFLENLDFVLHHVKMRRELPLSDSQKEEIIALLEPLKKRLATDVEEWYLAKGILQGSGTPLWRSLNHTLKGIGFNYDFPDSKGPSRELSSGKVIDAKTPLLPAPLIRVSDLLVTTGMDGVFPPGLPVAEVRKIFPSREGAFTYEIEAIPVVKNLDTLQTVFVIPPWSDEEELPKLGIKT